MIERRSNVHYVVKNESLQNTVNSGYLQYLSNFLYVCVFFVY